MDDAKNFIEKQPINQIDYFLKNIYKISESVAAAAKIGDRDAIKDYLEVIGCYSDFLGLKMAIQQETTDREIANLEQELQVTNQTANNKRIRAKKVK